MMFSTADVLISAISFVSFYGVLPNNPKSTINITNSAKPKSILPIRMKGPALPIFLKRIVPTYNANAFPTKLDKP
jgi:hypothetical protein